VKNFKRYITPYNIFLVIAGAIIILMVGHNIRLLNNGQNADFFKASFVDIASIALGSYIIFFLTEQLNDKRRRNDCIEHIITEIENMISDERFFSVSRTALMLQASCANKIKYLKDANFTNISIEVEFIESKITDIRELYSNHSTSEEELKGVLKDFEKKRNDISDKCDKIRVSLYAKLKS